MASMFNLVNLANKYMASSSAPKITILNKASDFINNILKILGVVEDDEAHFLGAKQMELEGELTAILDFIVDARSQIIGVYRARRKDADQAGAIAQVQEMS